MINETIHSQLGVHDLRKTPLLELTDAANSSGQFSDENADTARLASSGASLIKLNQKSAGMFRGDDYSPKLRSMKNQ